MNILGNETIRPQNIIDILLITIDGLFSLSNGEKNLASNQGESNDGFQYASHWLFKHYQFTGWRSVFKRK